MGERPRVLCVDDEQNVLSAIERIFIDDDCEILTAASGREGLDVLARTSPVHVVVSDYRMPEMNGVDFLRQVYEQWPDTVRIVLSGYADTASVVAAVNEGRIYKFISKPWNDDDLRIAISNAIDHYFLQRRNAELLEENRRLRAEIERLKGAAG